MFLKALTPTNIKHWETTFVQILWDNKPMWLSRKSMVGLMRTRASRISLVSVQSVCWELWSRSWMTLVTPHTLLLQYSHSALPRNEYTWTHKTTKTLSSEFNGQIKRFLLLRITRFIFSTISCFRCEVAVGRDLTLRWASYRWLPVVAPPTGRRAASDRAAPGSFLTLAQSWSEPQRLGRDLWHHREVSSTTTTTTTTSRVTLEHVAVVFSSCFSCLIIGLI